MSYSLNEKWKKKELVERKVWKKMYLYPKNVNTQNENYTDLSFRDYSMNESERNNMTKWKHVFLSFILIKLLNCAQKIFSSKTTIIRWYVKPFAFISFFSEGVRSILLYFVLFCFIEEATEHIFYSRSSHSVL